MSRVSHTSVLCSVILSMILSSCGGARLKAPNAKQYAKFKYTYDHMLDTYGAELALAHSKDAHAIHHCVLGRADEIRRLSGRQRYASYPFLEYTADLRAVISELERMSAQLMCPGSTPGMHHLSHQMRDTIQQLCAFKNAVVSDARYLQEQDKLDAAQQANDQQTALHLLLAQSMNPQKVVHEVRLYEAK